MAVLPRQRRWTPWFSPHIGDGWSGFGRGGGHQATFIARNGSGDSWNFPTLVHMGKKRRTRKAPPRRRGEQKAGAQSTGVQDGSRPHGRRVQSGKRAQARHGPASDVQDMLAWLRDCDRGSVPIRKCGNSPPRGLQEVGDGRSEEGRGATGYAYAATSRGSAGRWSTVRS